ncbi:MAG: hypothetical protein KDI47_18630, partial [Gammaproteobacteria bacterium]|nr:hypothetical protein [Gammaproteobacteria bacterium]
LPDDIWIALAVAIGSKRVGRSADIFRVVPADLRECCTLMLLRPGQRPEVTRRAGRVLKTQGGGGQFS